MIKRLLILLGAVVTPLILGMLFTFDVIKVEWISQMEIQPSFRPQEAPLPMPPDSVPVQGASYIPGLGAPVNPVMADDDSIARGKALFDINCALCHGEKADGKGRFAVFLVKQPPKSLIEGRPVTMSDGELFLIMANGVEGAMPPLRENLPQAGQRWDVVNYIRSLQ